MNATGLHRGDVWWADVPGDKRRPVLVLTRERFVSRLNAVIVAPITTAVRDIPTEVVLDVDDGMSRRCAANFDNILTVRRERFVERVTQLSADRLDDVCHALRFATGC